MVLRILRRSGLICSSEQAVREGQVGVLLIVN